MEAALLDLRGIVYYVHGGVVGMDYLVGVAPDFTAVFGKYALLLSVFFHVTEVVIPPVGVAGHHAQGQLLAAARDKQRDRRLGLGLALGVLNTVILALEIGRT